MFGFIAEEMIYYALRRFKNTSLTRNHDELVSL